jgi:transcription elongation factor
MAEWRHRWRDQETEVIGMVDKIHDRIVVESEKVGKAAREGDIIEVIEASYGTRYRVLWDDGHESTFRPAAGSARVIPAQKPPSK